MKNQKRLELIGEAVASARHIQDFLWGEANGAWGLEEWRRMFRKRIQKIEDIRTDNPHAIVELKKRLLQNAALCIGLLEVIVNFGIPQEEIPDGMVSNLSEYAKPDPPAA